MQKSGKKPAASAHRKVKTSDARSRKNLQRPKNSIEDEHKILIDKNRTMAGKSTSKKRTVSIIEHSSEPEIIVASPRAEMDEKDDVELLSTPKSDSELVLTSTSKMSAREIKERAIAKALSEAARPREEKVIERPMRTHFRWSRIIFAFACAAMAVFAIVYFVNLNSPDISLKVAAMQTGIDATYPSYVPRDYAISDIASENGRITLSFKNSGNGNNFVIIEEKSSWDSSALMSNFIQPEYGNDYEMIREQGLTLFISGDDAAWVNKGIVYKLKTISGTLTKKQIKAIAVSL